MITEEYLMQQNEKKRVRLDAMNTEIAENKLECSGTTVSNGNFVSFEYLREKIGLIRGFMRCIEDDIKHDQNQTNTKSSLC